VERARIMVVEDEAIVAMDLLHRLQSLGYDVSGTVASGEDAVEKASEIKPDLVLMDIMLNGKMSGIETAARLRQHWGIPVIYLTAYSDAQTVEMAKHTEPSGYLLKPFDERELKVAIEMALYKEKMEQEKRAQDLEMQRVLKMKSDFTAMVSHELRAPLTCIQEGIDLIGEASGQPDDQDSAEAIAIVKRNIGRLMRLIDSVLDYQKFDAEHLHLEPEKEDINLIVQETIQEFLPVADKKGLTIAAQLDANLPQVLCDKNRIIQVLMNLINNAIKFTASGTITVATSLWQGNVRVAIQDEGIGIHQKDFSKLFEQFGQIHNPATSKNEGSGLGLAISKKIVEAHNGQIGVTSVYGKGSTFYFILPLHN
jgi:signal transduction histidine kinase